MFVTRNVESANLSGGFESVQSVWTPAVIVFLTLSIGVIFFLVIIQMCICIWSCMKFWKSRELSTNRCFCTRRNGI